MKISAAFAAVAAVALAPLAAAQVCSTQALMDAMKLVTIIPSRKLTVCSRPMCLGEMRRTQPPN